MVKDLLTQKVMAGTWPPWGKVLFVMGTTIGLLGGLLFFCERLMRTGVATTHDVAKVVPLPIPQVVIHAALLFGLFELYAYVLGIGWIRFW